VSLGLAGVLIAAGMGLMLVKLITSLGYDPNGIALAARMRLARERAVLADDLDEEDFEGLAPEPLGCPRTAFLEALD
jgi:hypothetical protein